MIVDQLVIVEIKSVENLAPVNYKQLLTYLRLADKRLGLLINFGEGLIKNGISRVVNRLEEKEGAHAKPPRRKEEEGVKERAECKDHRIGRMAKPDSP
jgi:hypothetical protein